MALCDVDGGMWPPCIMGLILFMARQRVSIFYHIQGKNGRKSSFLAWPEMPCSPRRVCSGRGERRGIMTATRLMAGSPTKSRLFPFIPGLIPPFPAFSRLFPELIAGVWWLSGVVVVLA
ncbi:hypothetical protein ACRWYO_16730 [Escherichia coli]